MQEDLELTAKIEMPQEFNAAIEFNENFSGGAKAARSRADNPRDHLPASVDQINIVLASR